MDACNNGHLPVTDALIQAKADVNARSVSSCFIPLFLNHPSVSRETHNIYWMLLKRYFYLLLHKVIVLKKLYKLVDAALISLRFVICGFLLYSSCWCAESTFVCSFCFCEFRILRFCVALLFILFLSIN